jgi:outer membrane protein OmpA-like peptidoglycan-associated protein
MVTAPLAAQQKGSVEIGGFGRYTGYPEDSYDVQGPDDNRLGGGGRLGYFLSDKFALELSSSFNPTDLQANQPHIPSTIGADSRPIVYNPWHLYGIYNMPMGSAASFMLGAGANYTRLTKGIEHDGFGVGAIAGIRLKPTSWLHLRLEGTADMIPSGFNDESNTYLGAQAGLSLMFGGGCDHSTDMIGIRPSSVALTTGQSQTFMADASWCGEPDAVVYRLTGPGTLDSLTGRYTATTPGTAQVTAYSRRGNLMSSANVTVTAPAPPPPPPPPPPAVTFQLQMVHFRFDRSDLTAGATDTLNAVVRTLQANPSVNVDVVGHTDWIGTNAYNMRLSQARAETVRRFLVEHGIAEGRITVRWRGEEEPIADNESTAGRAQNRRSEIRQNN